MKVVIIGLLVVILAVLAGIFSAQLREREDRQKQEAVIELAKEQEKEAIRESERRNRESARQAAEGEKEAEKKLKEVFGY